MAPQLAWIGLGNIGRASVTEPLLSAFANVLEGMCKNLVAKGNLDKPLILYNRTKKRADDLSAALGTDKTEVVETIQDAAKSSDIIFLCLSDDAAVNSAVDAILEQDVTGKVVVDSSTVHPDTTNALEKRLTAKGALFVGMPGSPHAVFSVYFN
jgi:3-hydroxyisobutyrate dehydrogenase-like beta-hydroxyacid dehydrogenase